MFKLSGSEHPNLLRVYENASKVFDEGLIFRKRKKRERIYRFLRRLSIGIITVSGIIIFLLAVDIANFRIIQSESVQGKINIEKAISLLEKNDNKSAIYYSKMAQNNFGTSLSYLHEYKGNFLVKSFGFFGKQYNDVDYLLSTANTLSRGVEEASSFRGKMDSILINKGDFSKLSETDKKKILQFVYESAPELFGIKANIDLALTSFQQINYIGILSPFRSEIYDIGQKIKLADYLLDQQIPMSEILPAFFGYPEKSKYLVVFQDSRTLMPTGGAIKAYGVMENSLGEIAKFDTADSKILDNNLRDSVSVDLPLSFRNHTGKEKWLMSDANWSPDWPESAEKIKWFYEKETGDKSNLDGVIAINNDFIKELLNLSGPIMIDNISYDSGNFIKLYDSGTDKKVFGKLIKEIKLKLFDQNYSNYYDFFTLLSSNLAKKNLVLYFKDVNFEQIAEEKGWSSEIKNPDGDYLLVVDSNLGGSENDNYISKNINYQIDQDVNGVFADLSINYANNILTNFKNFSYKNYVRIYVPKGSLLINADGFDEKGVEVSDDKENNKTIFAGMIVVEPGKIANVKIRYKLPQNIESLVKQGEYGLYAQKQPGNNVDVLMVDLKFGNSIKLYNPTGFNVDLISDKNVRWSTNLLTDRLFSVNLFK